MCDRACHLQARNLSLKRAATDSAHVVTPHAYHAGCVTAEPARRKRNDMKLGISAVVTDQTIRPDRLGVAVEERGFNSVFLIVS
jgi:hypothetical protein